MDPKEIYADVNALDHVKEVCLKNERFSWVIEYTRSMLQFLEILQASTDFFGDFYKSVLEQCKRIENDTNKLKTNAFCQQLLTCFLHISAPSFNGPPAF